MFTLSVIIMFKLLSCHLPLYLCNSVIVYVRVYVMELELMLGFMLFSYNIS